MKRVFAFLLLVSHMNTSMFLPQVRESDVYDKNGEQVDDINSVVEYIMVSLGIDHTADDEDNDNGQNFHLVKLSDCVFNPFFTLIKVNNLPEKNTSLFREFTNNKIHLLAYDVMVPPPKNA